EHRRQHPRRELPAQRPPQSRGEQRIMSPDEKDRCAARGNGLGKRGRGRPRPEGGSLTPYPPPLARAPVAQISRLAAWAPCRPAPWATWRGSVSTLEIGSVFTPVDTDGYLRDNL